MSVFRNVGIDEPEIQGVGYDDQPVFVGVALGLDDEFRIALRNGAESEIILNGSEVQRLIARLTLALKVAGEEE